jgi:hypothetical protein
VVERVATSLQHVDVGVVGDVQLGQEAALHPALSGRLALVMSLNMEMPDHSNDFGNGSSP